MSRAILVSAGGDPLLASFCIDLIKKNCYNVIDSIYVCYNNSTDTPKEVETEFLGRYLDDPKIKIIYWPTQLGYGLPITKMLQVCEEDLVMLLEDDGFLLQEAAVDSAFKQIENNHVDALGSPRFSCGTEISEALKLKYNLDYSGYGDVGPNFWPNFFFCRKRDLLDTDLNFAPKSFEKGIYYSELNHTMSETEGADTFVWACIQMRHTGVRFGNIPQFHSSPYEITDKEKSEGNWRGVKPYWIHGGSLSVGAGKYLRGVVPDVSAEISKQEIESRVAWWSVIASNVEGFDSYRSQYKKGILELMEKAQLDEDRIMRKVDIYEELL